MPELNVLLKTESEQTYIATTTTNSEILDVLANSDSTLVRMTVLSNPAVSIDTVRRKIDDKDQTVWKTASNILNARQ